MAALAEAQDWRCLRYTVLRALGIAVALAVPTVAALVFLAHPAIRILFQHGKFGAGPALLTYHVLIAYSIALPAYVGSEIVTRTLIAVRDTRTPLFTNTVQVAGRIAIMVVLLGAIGIEAIPVAFAVMASLEAVVLTATLPGRLQRRVRLTEGPIPVSA